MNEETTSKPIGAAGEQVLVSENDAALSEAQSKATVVAESVTFVGSGTVMIPVENKSLVVIDGIQQTKVTTDKVPVKFKSDNKYRATVTDPVAIKWLRAKGHKEVAQSVLDKEKEDFRMANRAQKVTNGGMEGYVADQINNLKEELTKDGAVHADDVDFSAFSKIADLENLKGILEQIGDAVNELNDMVSGLKSDLSVEKGRVTNLKKVVDELKGK